MEPTPSEAIEAPPPPPKPPKPKRVSWWRRVPSLPRLIIFSLFTFSLGAGTLLGGFEYIQNIVPVDAAVGLNALNPITMFSQEDAGRRAFQGRDRLNILVLGIDYNYDRKDILYTKGARSDSMMVVSISPKADLINIVSIPRDCQVLISEKYGTEKINAAYSFGGPKQAMETVSQFLGVPIDHYLVVKVYGAVKIFDALGGVPIDVEKTMDYDDNWGHLHVHLKKGPQVLTGEQAVGYARFRHDEESDRGRMRRQQQTIRALVDKLKDPGLVMRIPELAKAVKQTLETDMTVLDMADLAHLYQGFDQKKIRSAQVVGDDTMINGVSMIIPYGPENQKIVRRMLKDESNLGVSELRVRVLNGSHDSLAAQRLADRLNLEGFNVVNVTSADNDSYNTTQVQEHTKSPRAHGVLAGVLAGAQFKDTPAPKGIDADVTIIVGNDQILITQTESWPAQTLYTGSQSASRPVANRPRPVEVPDEPAVDPEPVVAPEPERPIEVEHTPAPVIYETPHEVPHEIPLHDPAPPVKTPKAPAPVHEAPPAPEPVVVPPVTTPAAPVHEAPPPIAPPATPIPPVAPPPAGAPPDSGWVPGWAA